MKSTATWALAILLGLPSALPAQAERDQPETVTLTVDPAPEPRPALKYRLLPGYLERRPGNAAPYYYRAMLRFKETQGRLDRERRDRFYDWLEKPLEELPVSEIKQHPLFHEGAFGQLKEAAYREDCDWDLRLKDRTGTDLFSVLLGEFQESRNLAWMLSLKAAVEIREGRHDDALETIRVGLQLGRDVGRPRLIITKLVGVAITSIMHDRLLDLIQQPGAPNLHWAAGALPAPLISLQPAVEHESQFPYVMFPFLRDIETADYPKEQWNRHLMEVIATVEKLDSDAFALFGSGSGLPRWNTQLGTLVRLMRGYPEAQRRLAKTGFADGKIHSLPVAQVVLIDTVRTFDALSQDIVKWSYVPVPQAHQRMRRAEKRLHPDNRPREIIPMGSKFMPSVRYARIAGVRLQRRFAALRTIEALRLYAAGHGELPESLDQITAVVVPEDPVQGALPDYRRAEKAAILTYPAPEGYSIRRYAKRYEITLRR